MTTEQTTEDLLARHKEALEQIKELKEKAATETSAYDGPSIIYAFREGQTVARGFVKHERDETLRLVNAFAFSFSADTVAVAMETLTSTHNQNPYTGEDWEQGDMQWLAEAEGGREKGWVIDSLTVHTYDRGGHGVMSSCMYTVDDGQVTWTDQQDFDNFSEGHQVHGLVPEALTKIMTEGALLHDEATKKMVGEPLLLAMEQAMGTNDAERLERRLFHEDMAAVRLIHDRFPEQVFGVELSSEPGSLRFDLMRERGELALRDKE